MHVIEKWGCFELEFAGPADGNPYLDTALSVVFSPKSGEAVTATGFYDGDGVYRARFMPSAEGEWTYRSVSSCPELDGWTGSFVCVAPSAGNHGPVSVRNTFHFAYADGTPFLPFGTTCYAWTHQPLAMQRETLDTLSKAGFNKIRMCVFPKHYIYNENEPLHDVFLRAADGSPDFDRPNPAAFRHFENQARALMRLGIEADIIIFHPYDRWGYCSMSHEQDLRYVRYLAARLGAYRNVWWSMANEYDFLLDVKPVEHWDNCFKALMEADPHHHLKSIHNGEPDMNYDHGRPWIDHVCIQNSNINDTASWRKRYGKPIVNDELQYEGNIPRTWGNISARELVHRVWLTVMRGGYAGHGETYMHPDDLLWWAKGGVLRGESAPRIAFLRRILEEDAKNGLTPITAEQHWTFRHVSGADDGDVRYIYFCGQQPAEWAVGLPKEDGDYQIDLIDTWEMTVSRLEKAPLPASPALRQRGGAILGEEPEAAFGIRLPGKPHMAVRIKKLS